jgi:hypothetical protein
MVVVQSSLLADAYAVSDNETQRLCSDQDRHNVITLLFVGQRIVNLVNLITF